MVKCKRIKLKTLMKNDKNICSICSHSGIHVPWTRGRNGYSPTRFVWFYNEVGSWIPAIIIEKLSPLDITWLLSILYMFNLLPVKSLFLSKPKFLGITPLYYYSGTTLDCIIWPLLDTHPSSIFGGFDHIGV